jgi:hypothetical protein
MSMGNFFHGQECNYGMLFEPHIFTAFHLDWHRTGVVDTCGFKVMYVGGEISHDCVETVLSTFHYSNKNMTEEAKLVSPSSYHELDYNVILNEYSCKQDVW